MPGNDEIEAKETALQENKNDHNSFDVGPTNSTTTYDELQ